MSCLLIECVSWNTNTHAYILLRIISENVEHEIMYSNENHKRNKKNEPT